MKKSMLTLVGCALAAGTVMAAEVAGNNVAVVIQKDAVVSNNFYQFLVVPVKGFDITGEGTATTLTLEEIFPAAAYVTGTIVYKASDPDVIYTKQDSGWKYQNGLADASAAEFSANDIIWMLSTSKNLDPTVFCGEQSQTEVSVTPKAGSFVAFGNATSAAVDFEDINAGGFLAGDQIYLVQEGSSDYLRLVYNGSDWTKPPAGSGRYEAIVPGTDVFPAGGAAYYYRK